MTAHKSAERDSPKQLPPRDTSTDPTPKDFENPLSRKLLLTRREFKAPQAPLWNPNETDTGVYLAHSAPPTPPMHLSDPTGKN